MNRQLEYIEQFLLDTGSEGNLVKISSLPFDCGININETIFLKGVSGKIVFTLGTTEISIFGYPTKFQIVTEDFPIPREGLLGAESGGNVPYLKRDNPSHEKTAKMKGKYL